MKENRRIISLDSVDTYCRLYGLVSSHPLVAVIDLNKARNPVNHITVNYGVYALYLKNGVKCTLMYGRQPCDCQNGTVVSFAPGHLIGMDAEDMPIKQDVVGLLFHPDAILGTPLGGMIHKYSFFDYSQRESLHLSEQERAIFTGLLERIKSETENPVDQYSQEIISSLIQTLLEYLNRFYSRQFTTRRKENMGILQIFEKELREYYRQGKGEGGVPSVAYFAGLVNLSPGYFGDLVKRETGCSPQEFIARYLINIAKQRLATTDDDISIIAYDMGYQYPQHFSRKFKDMTDLSPSAYRKNVRSRLNESPGGSKNV